jgi:Protein of unknown function (DUF3107)
VEVKIGVQHASREVTIDVEETAETIEKYVSETIASPDGVITLTDARGRKVVVPGAKVAYVEIGHGVAGAVGFRS